MKINIFGYVCCLVVCLLTSSTEAKEVNKQAAEQVAKNAYTELINNSFDFQVKEVITIKSDELITLYVVNFKPTGFVMVSASDATIPILANSTKDNFKLDNLPTQLTFLLENYKKQVKEIEKSKIEPTKEIKEKWNKFLDLDFLNSNSLKSASTILSQAGPLLSSVWNQNSGWNQFCPVDSNSPGGYNGHVPAGCGAVALAQILYYWNCRVNEQGSNTVSSQYGNLYANFTEANYIWGNMSSSSPNEYSAKLIYHCGIATYTDYNPNGSGTYMSYISNALNSFFGFKSTTNYYSNEYTDTEWKTMLKNDLNMGRPLLFSGSDDEGPVTGAHAWVIDGYDAYDKFHCNWGWGGSYNGFYYLNNLNPSNYLFTPGFIAILNIEPVMSSCDIINGGSSVECSGTSYYVPNLPFGATVTWETSSNIISVSSQPSNPCIFRSANNISDSGWIKATVNYNGTATLEPKYVSVGAPLKPYFDTSTDLYCDGLKFVVVEENNQIVTWDVTPPLEIIGSKVGHKCTIATTGNYSGQAWITATAHNSCASLSTTVTVNVECSELILSPNPASTEMEVSIANEISNESILTPDKKLDIKIFNNMGGVVYKDEKVGNKIKVPVSSIKDGIYIVEVSYNNKLYNKQLVIKH